jgi:hypothetical protein
VSAPSNSAQESPATSIRWEKNYLTIRNPRMPGEVEINYLEAFCRPGSTDRDWNETVIPHTTKLIEATPDGRRIRLQSVLEDGVIVDHEIRAEPDEVDFRLTARNPTGTASQAHWAQPCMRVDRFTGTKRAFATEEYLPKCFIFLDGKLAPMPTRSWAKRRATSPARCGGRSTSAWTT